jgi:hypothetical protein
MRRGAGALRNTVVILASCLAAAAVAGAATDNPALASMADAERAFAKAAATRGIRAAFLEYLDDDAVGFQPALGRAKDTWNSRPEPANPTADRLEWDPRTGDVSVDGSLGWLSGPYRFVASGDKTTPAYGCYFSIWRRPDAASPWRVFIDLGVGTPQPCAFPAGFARQAVTNGPAGTRDALLAADRALDARIVTSGLAALTAVADEQLRVHREGGQPVVGRDAVRQALKAVERPGTFTPIDGAVAGSGDLGYTYGKVEGPGEKPAYYVRVWRTGPTGAWRLTFDTVSR